MTPQFFETVTTRANAQIDPSLHVWGSEITFVEMIHGIENLSGREDKKKEVAAKDARCDGPTLRKLAAPVSSALSGFSSLKDAITAGNFGGIAGAGALLSGLTSNANQNGITLK